VPSYIPLPHKVVDNFVAPKCNDVFDILFQDDDILLINKPSGLLSLSGKNPKNWDSLHYRLVYGQSGVSAVFPKAKLPHRLDFGTSGIMVVGLNVKSAQSLNKQFQKTTVKKRYVAVLEGWVSKASGIISASIAKDPQHFPRVKICSTNGKVAVSEYRVLELLNHPRRSLVEFSPLTGRTHQLRIHSQFIGHPILGCDLYKSVKSEKLSDRLLLHSSELFFDHPVTGERIHGSCPCPF
jgi:tRNA pseudouridine32 synthase/23S rRNA pseudouridine746 synthase